MAGRQNKSKLILIFRIAVALIVIVALVYTVQQSISRLSEQNFQLGKVAWGYWGAAILVYCCTMAFSGLFWYFVLIAFGQGPKLGQSMLAFFASQLGKYVPGKAMVVVIRTEMIRGEKVSVVPAAASVFVETLTWLFVGSAIACLLLAVQFREQVALMGTAVIFTIAAGFLTWPAVFRKLAGVIVQRKSKSAGEFLSGLNLKVMSQGWLLIGVGWCLNGLSLWLVLAGIPGTDIVWSDFPVTLACVSLATVAGFVSLLPGGLGVREVVMIPLLGLRFGAGTALVATVAIRLVWLSAELAGAGIIYGLAKRPLSSSSDSDRNSTES